jgi:predicted PurR-regulated permease PerM
MDFAVHLILMLIVGLYLAAEGPLYIGGLVSLFPRAKRARTREVLGVLGVTIRGWLIGQMVSMSFLGLFAFAGLSLLEIPLALTLALLTGLLTFIPNLGPILSVIPPMLLALTQSPIRALYVLLFYIALQSIEGNFVTPMVMRHVIRLPPALLILSQLLLAVLFGFIGLVLAAPMVAVALVLVKLLYLEDILGEHVNIPGYTTHGS